MTYNEILENIATENEWENWQAILDTKDLDVIVRFMAEAAETYKRSGVPTPEEIIVVAKQKHFLVSEQLKFEAAAEWAIGRFTGKNCVKLFPLENGL